MLQAIRDRATGIIAWVIVILISIPFALWGVHEYFGGGGEPVVAEVDGAEITLRAYREALLAERNRLRELLGGRALGEAQEALLRKRVLESLIEDELIAARARDLGLHVGDALLAARIRARPEFQREGRFDRGLYEARLRAAGLSVPGYEALMRRAIASAQLRSAFDRAAVATPAEVEAFLRLQGQQRRLTLVTVPAEAFLDGVEVGEDEVRRYYESHAAEFTEPERVRVAYVDLTLDAVAREIPVDEDALRSLYEEEKARFVAPEERRVAHILIPVPKDAGPEAEAKARAEAEALLARIRRGEDFAALAKERSADPGSAAKGGDLGFVGRGVLDEPLEEAVFALKKPGEVAGPVRTRFGYHIVKLLAVRGGKTKPFEAVRDALAREYRRRQAEARFYELADRLANLAYEQPDSLEPAAKAVGVPVRESGWFSREAGEGIAADPRVRAAAFGEAVLEGDNSDPIELGPDRVVVLRLLERRPARRKPLAEVEGTIRERLRRAKAGERAAAAAERLLEAVAGGADPARAAAGVQGAKVEGPRWVGRGGGGWPPAVVRRGFQLPRPAAGRAVADRVPLAGGDQAVVVLHAVRDGDPSKADEAERRGVAEAIARARGEAALRAALATWRERAEVEVFESVVAEAER